MVDVIQTDGNYTADFARLEQETAGSEPSWISPLRKAALSRFTELGFPTRHHEEWRFTNVTPIAQTAFRLAGPDMVRPEALERFAFPELSSSRIVFVNGHYAPDLSAPAPLPAGVRVGSLAAALAADPAAVEPHLARLAGFEDSVFTALNTAFLREGAFVSIPRNVIVEEPIHLLFVSTGAAEPTVSHPRTLIVVGENSQATLVESYVGLGEGVYFTNAVTEVVVGANAVIDHYKVQRETERAYHVGGMHIRLDRSSAFSSHSIALGGAIVRNDAGARLNGEGGECTLNGLYMGHGQQLVDNHTVIDHAMPHCNSHELYKGILNDKARGVFNGKIFVRPDAQKTDAKQTNQTLLLSEDAQINTKPQLEIFADDVKCTHGATVGQLDEEAVFYCRSRGIGEAQARSLLIYAFAGDIIGRIKIEPIRAQLDGILLTQLPGR